MSTSGFDLKELFEDTLYFFWGMFHILKPLFAPVWDAGNFYRSMLGYFDGDQFFTLVTFGILMGMYAFFFGCVIYFIHAVYDSVIKTLIVWPIILIGALILSVIVGLVSIFIPHHGKNPSRYVDAINNWLSSYFGDEDNIAEKPRKETKEQPRKQIKVKPQDAITVWYISQKNVSK